jgi:DNA-directed RNA polymerase subunit RPC12/RpoP
MASTSNPAPAGAPIYRDERIPEGYVFVCFRSGSEHSFILRKLGPSIECPKCGHTALPAALLDAYCRRTISLGVERTFQPLRSDYAEQ